MTKAMHSARGQGTNRSNARRHCEDLQRGHRVEGALSCFEISVGGYQADGVDDAAKPIRPPEVLARRAAHMRAARHERHKRHERHARHALDA